MKVQSRRQSRERRASTGSRRPHMDTRYTRVITTTSAAVMITMNRGATPLTQARDGKRVESLTVSTTTTITTTTIYIYIYIYLFIYIHTYIYVCIHTHTHTHTHTTPNTKQSQKKKHKNKIHKTHTNRDTPK